jgi:hypothetical protein
MEKLKDIIRNNKMSTRPEFYSGRGAITCDLNGEILEGIYKGIKKEFGENSAKNFVKMVDDIKVLSATTFLEELYVLFSNDWKYRKKRSHAAGVTVPKNADGEYDLVGGMFGMMNAMMNNRDETQQIKSYFLSRHGVKPKGKVVNVWYGGNNCYEVRDYL